LTPGNKKNVQYPPGEKLKPIFMKTKSMAPLGSLHPVLFFAGLYTVALIFSVFICSSLFYACNTSSSKTGSTKQVPKQEIKNQAASALAVR
jgi:hypothetical protein